MTTESDAATNNAQDHPLMPHLDVTILGESATTQAVRDLVDQVLALDAEAPHPAAICIPVDRIVDALADGRGEQQLAAFGTRVATVLNFPHGQATLFDDVRHDLDRALVAGAHEIDVVFPYRYYLGDGEDVQDDDDDASTRPARCKQFLMDIVTAVHRAHALVKVILETAAFPTTASITAASRLAITAGVDFLKTSTGFHPKGGATHDAVHAMLEAVRESGAQAHVGIKVSGGVRSVEQARGYLRQVQHVYSEGAVPLMTARHFRIGTSALFHVLLRAGKGGDESAAVKGSY